MHGSASLLQLFLLVWIFLRSLGIICYDSWVLSEGHKNQWIMVILSKGCKPDNFEMHNSQKLSFTNIWGLHLNFIDCESFLESNSPDILALCEANLDDSTDSGNFSVRGYLSLTWEDSFTHMHGLAVYVKEGLPFAWDLSLENSADSYLRFWLALLHSVSYFFFLYQSPSSSLCTVFDSISSNIDEVLSINPYANVFVFRDFNVHLKDWLTVLVELIDLGNSVTIFLSQTTLLRLLTFLLRSRLWFLQSYSFGHISFFWCHYLFYNGFPTIVKVWKGVNLIKQIKSIFIFSPI